MNQVTLVYPYYKNPSTLNHHVALWNALPRWMSAALAIRVIDDGTQPPADQPDHLLEMCTVPNQLYRILEDKPWNQHGARNLGAAVAPNDDDWLLMTDMDIVVPEEVLCYILQVPLDRRLHYFFGRRFADGRPDKPHCNSFLVTKKNFWAAGGYDERFCGTYGGDGIFTRALERVSARVDLPHKLLGLNDMIHDCSTRGLGRKDSEFHDEYIRRRDEFRGAPPLTLQFQWERVW